MTDTFDVLAQAGELANNPELLSRIMDTVPVGISVVSADGRIVYANLKAESILGLTRGEITSRAYNAPQWKETDPDGRPIPAEELPFSRIMATGEPVDNHHSVIEWQDGTKTFLSVNGSPLFASDGELAGAVFSLDDVSELRRYQRDLGTETNKLTRSNEELEQFVYVASHDLQEPLRAVTGFLQLLLRREKERLGAESLRYIEKSMDAAARMQTLIGDLLRYSGVNTHAGDSGPVDAEEIMQKVKADLSHLLDRGAELTWDALPMVPADDKQLHRLLLNLASNGFKYNKSDPPRVHVSCSEHRRKFVFHVKDNGIGIDPRYFSRIFLIFKRLHSKSEYAGTGIGLAICKKIVERHGGKLWVESTPGEGAVFHFSLPKSGQ